MRIRFSVIFLLLIVAMAVCAVAARRSHKAIGKSVSLLIASLIPPLIGNLIIIASTNEMLSTLGCYSYFLGMDLVMFALLHFTYDYCRISSLGKVFSRIAHIVLGIDVLQLLCNPIFGQAFATEAIVVDGLPYYRLIPYLGQSFHRAACYSVMAAVLVVFFLRMLRSPRINSERYSVILLTMIIATLWQTFYIFSRTPIDRSMIGFGVFGLLIFYFSLFYRPMRLLDRMLATIASELPEALFFFDNSNQCIWANQPGIDLLDVKDGDFDPVAERLTQRFGDIEQTAPSWSGKHVSGDGDAVKSYVLDRRAVTDDKGRVIGAFLSVRDNTDEQKTLSLAIYNATHDSLTHVYNRAGYDLLLPDIDLSMTIMLLIDVDNFKHINDTYGHEVGDRILQKIAQTLERHFRAGDSVCRIGGDEFIILMLRSDERRFDLIRERIQRINTELSNPEDGLPPVTISVGAAYGGNVSDPSELFKRADHALYDTKHNGRSGLTFFEEQSDLQTV